MFLVYFKYGKKDIKEKTKKIKPRNFSFVKKEDNPDILLEELKQRGKIDRNCDKRNNHTL